MTLVPMRVSAAVTVSSFTAKAKAPQIEIDWTTATEINNSGFNLLRSTSQNGTYTKIAGLIPSKNPGSILGANYSYTDGSVTAGQTYFYKLQSVESSGGTQHFGPVSAVVAAAATPIPSATTAPTSAPAPAATNTPIKSPTSVPTPSPTATSLPLPSSASSPVAAGSAPSPTRVAKIARAVATPTQNSDATTETQNAPTPALTLVAIGIKRITPEPDVSDTEAETDTPTVDSTSSRSYYLVRLFSAGFLLSAASLAFGSLVLGTLAVYFFLRANLR